MRTYVVVFCVLAVSTLVLGVPWVRQGRQISFPGDTNTNTNSDSDSDVPVEDISSFWWNQRPTRPTRPTPPPVTTTTTTQASEAPAGPSPAALWRCMQTCLRTPQYDPECAQLLNGARKTYSNGSERSCAQQCGENSTFLFRGNCQGF